MSKEAEDTSSIEFIVLQTESNNEGSDSGFARTSDYEDPDDKEGKTFNVVCLDLACIVFRFVAV